MSNVVDPVLKTKRSIAAIDAMFEGAAGWGSWMVGAGNERKSLVERLAREHGIKIEHRYVPMTGGRGPVT